jgi:ribonuclease BN (tRNA processing enzyme)
MEVRLLGTGGWLPTDERETACVYVRSGPDVLLLDAGTGARRLITEPALLNGVERLHVVLSHFHLDHVMGLVALAGLPLEREIWMPARLLAGLPADDVFERLVDPPFFTGTDVVGTPRELEGDREVGPFRIEIRIQPQHPGKTIAVKVDGRLVYCTDTAYDAENIGFARGASILLHESFWPGDTTDDPSHTAAGEAGRLAAKSGVEQLVLVHINPEGCDDDELATSARAHFAASEVGCDGVVLV